MKQTKITRVNYLVGFLVVAFAIFINAAAMAEQVLVSFASGEKITAEDVAVYLNRRVDLKGMARSAYGVESILEEMAFSRALTLEGQAIGLEPPQGRKIERFDDVYGLSVYQKIIEKCVEPQNDEERKKFYQANLDVFRIPASVRLERIMLPSSEKIDGKLAGEILTDWSKAIVAGERKFEDFAMQAEKYYAMDVQGDLGWVNLSDDVPVMRILNDARQGQIVGPVEDGEYVYLFLVVKKNDAHQLSFDDARSDFRARVDSFCRKQEKQKLKQKLFLKYSIEIKKMSIKNIFPAKMVAQ